MTEKKNKKSKTENITQTTDSSETISTLESSLRESTEKYLRLSAEFENYKKRVQKEKEELVNGTKVKMLQSILDMDNDLSYAVKSSKEVGSGLKLIITKLDTFLKSQGIEPIQTETYDEELHEVLSIIKSDKSGIVDVVSKGYTLNGKPFRYPKIILSQGEQ
ncbi:MAG: nucleotide exchange factor GrpE [Verrucomicrobia bacterium]|nr:nucleotide exchange factor GrpE [Verrucomicrobiota bacterium]